MNYISTRGTAPALGFSDAVLAGLARDGGLYVPEVWPELDRDTIAGMAGQSYEDVALAVLEPFTGGEIDADALRRMIDEAYATFAHPAVTPLVQTDDNEFVLELFHGPTMAFKDVAMQLLARIMDHILSARGERVTIVGATSGDTGGAAIEAFRGRDNSDIFIMFPDGRVSDVQRRQMTTVPDANVHALAIEGDFDDCQALLKAMFNHHGFRDAQSLSGVNSINWGRIMAQIVYYFTAAVALGGPHRAVSFAVPTGNFGDIFAGWVAGKMGLPINRLIVATNENDILARTLASGRYEKTPSRKTTSPSMDIQVSSNFERLLFEASGRDAGFIRDAMSSLQQSGAFALPPEVLEKIRSQFEAGRASNAEADSTIATVLQDGGMVLDPHTACGVAVARKLERATNSPMVVLGTAHPAKFPDAVEAASGVHPPLPARCAHLMDGEERFTVLPNELEAVEAYIAQYSRASK